MKCGNDRFISTVPSQCLAARTGADGGAGAAGPGSGSAEADATDRMADAGDSVGDGLHGI